MREKLWMEKYKGADLKDHHQRLRDAQHMVDASSPPKAQRSERLARERARKAKYIDKDNNLMLHRLARVIQKKNIDNDPFRLKAMSKDMGKKREMRKLQKENSHMLHRLQHAEKTYCAATMAKEEAQRQQVLRRMCDQTLKPPSHSPITRPSSSNAALRPRSADRHISPPNRRKKTAWQGTAIALVEQDTMHLSSEIRPLRAASPVFKTVFPGNNSGSTPSLSRQQEGGGGSFNQHQNARRRRPKTASDAVYDRNGIRMASTQSSQFQSPPQLPNSVTSDTPSVARTREMKRLFKKPTGAYMSAKL